MDLLIQNLQKHSVFDHKVDYFKVIETHISWILLTGQWVYKIKKPLDMGFLDFSTLEKRRFYCHEEIRLNSLLAPQIYEEVVQITGSLEHPQINGEGPTIEYAVRMKEFSQANLFDKLLSDEKIDTQAIHQVAQIISEFHQKTARAGEDSPYGTHSQVHEPVVQNFDQILEFLTHAEDIALLKEIAVWAHHQHHLNKVTFEHRKSTGFIRECHGDVHLGNIAIIENKPTLFDCIEFNESFRWTDTMADLAFLAMDLEDKQQSRLANRLINSYLQATGDYHGLAILDYYKSYRAVVRAKIALFHHAQMTDVLAKNQIWQNYSNCMMLAKQYTHKKPLALVIMHGLPASGKSSIANQLSEALGFIHISSDIERKRLAGVHLTAQHQFGLYEGIYQPNMTDLTYEKLENLTLEILGSGYPVLVDASFVAKKYREHFRQIAKEQKIPFIIVHTYAPLDILRERIIARTASKDQISEAYPQVLEVVRQDIERLEPDEGLILNVDMSQPVNLTVLEEKIRELQELFSAVE